MSAAKPALESDTRTLASEAGRKWGHRVNVISAGPYASRAASAIGFIDDMIDYCGRNSPLTRPSWIRCRMIGKSGNRCARQPSKNAGRKTPMFAYV